jgi:hypothetical protein
MNDRPTAAELVAAARGFLEGELLPALSDARLRFQTLVTANVLAIAERELAGEEDPLREEWRWLAGLLDLPQPGSERLGPLREAVRAANDTLCQRIRAGAFDEPARFRSLAGLLRRAVEAKLAVANPRYLAAARPQPG